MTSSQTCCQPCQRSIEWNICRTQFWNIRIDSSFVQIPEHDDESAEHTMREL